MTREVQWQTKEVFSVAGEVMKRGLVQALLRGFARRGVGGERCLQRGTSSLGKKPERAWCSS